MGKLREYVKNHRGQAMVEFALILPVFLLFLCSIIEFGRMFNQSLIVNAAAREGARVVVVSGDEVTATQVAKGYAAPINGDGTVAVTFTYTPDNSSGNPVIVRVTHTMKLVTPVAWLSNGSVTDNVTLTGSATMRME